ncbi:MAG: response regulator [Candidatus Methylomirabilia bacterium]
MPERLGVQGGDHGRWVEVDSSISLLRDTRNAVVWDSEVMKNGTERRRVEEEPQREREARAESAKLAAMGSVLAGVAHELNTPLTSILGHIALFREMAVAEPLAQPLERIDQAAQRCARIVRDFLALARQEPAEPRRVQLNQVVEEAVELLVNQLRVDDVEVRLNLARDLPLLWGDAHQLHQVAVNLISNAHQAMRESAAPRQLTLTTRFDPAQGWVSLEVADTGPEIPPEIRPRIFEPFFTTKPPGQGTGLGLSLCQGLVESHGGSIRVESQPGRGTLFVVELPVVEPPVAEPGGGAAEAPPSPQGKTHPVVDDEGEMARSLDDDLGLVRVPTEYSTWREYLPSRGTLSSKWRGTSPITQAIFSSRRSGEGVPGKNGSRKMAKILVADDEPDMCSFLAEVLQAEGFEVVTAEDGRAALDLVTVDDPAVAILDLRMPGLDGLAALEKLKAIAPQLPVIMLTAYGDIATAVQAMRLGAHDYLTKPCDSDDIVITVRRALERQELLATIEELRSQLCTAPSSSSSGQAV